MLTTMRSAARRQRAFCTALKPTYRLYQRVGSLQSVPRSHPALFLRRPLATQAAVSDKLPTISVAGWASCSFYQKALAAANTLVDQGKFSAVEDVHFESKEPYKEWLASNTRPKFADTRADSHTSSPFVWVGDRFVGGCDDTLALPREFEMLAQYSRQVDCLVEEHPLLVISKSW